MCSGRSEKHLAATGLPTCRAPSGRTVTAETAVAPFGQDTNSFAESMSVDITYPAAGMLHVIAWTGCCWDDTRVSQQHSRGAVTHDWPSAHVGRCISVHGGCSPGMPCIVASPAAAKAPSRSRMLGAKCKRQPTVMLPLGCSTVELRGVFHASPLPSHSPYVTAEHLQA